MIKLELWRDHRHDPRSLFKTWNTIGQDLDNFFDVYAAGANRLRAPEGQVKGSSTHYAACDIQESDKAFLVSLDVPGFKKSDLQIEFDAKKLTVSGKREQETLTDDSRLHRRERQFGDFRREFVLPENIKGDKIEANYENGVLYLVIPKAEIEPPKRITIGENPGDIFQKLSDAHSQSESVKQPA